MSKFFSDKQNYVDGRNTASEFKAVMPVNVNTDFLTLDPALEQVEDEYIKPVLGEALFAKLAEYYAKTRHKPRQQEPNVSWEELVHLCQAADVRLALWDSYDQLKTNLSETGASSMVEADKRLYRYEDDALRRSLESQGMRCLDKMAQFCDDHTAVFTDFVDTVYHSFRADSIIKDRQMFDEVVPINRSAVTFRHLRPVLTDIEHNELAIRLGSTLAEKAISEPLSNRMRHIMPQIRQFVCHRAMAETADILCCMPTEFGVMVTTDQFSGSGGSGRVMQQADKATLEAYIAKENERAERAMSVALTYIKNHLDTYPEASEIGGEFMPTDAVYRRDNNNKKTFVF